MIKSIKSLLYVVLLSIGIPWNVYAQSFQFSQFNFTQQRVNPASVSMTDYARAAIDYRNQSTAANFNLKSSYVEMSYPLIARNGGSRWSGLGISFLDDRAGESGLFKINEVGLSYAINVFISKRQTLNLGFRSVYQSRRISFDGLFTGSQFVPGRGFDNGLNSGEAGAGLSQNFFSFSSGLAWQKVDSKGNQIARFDLSIFDFNKPEESFFETDNTLPSTFVASVGFLAYQKDAFQVFPEVLFTNSSSNSVINVGGILSYDFENSPLAINASGKVHVITKYVVGKYFITGLQFEKEKFKVGVSYDLPVGTEQVGNQGAIEFGAEIRNLITSKNKAPKRRIKKIKNRRVKKPRIKKRKIRKRKVRRRRIPKRQIIAKRKKKKNRSRKKQKGKQVLAQTKTVEKKDLTTEEEVLEDEGTDALEELNEEVLDEKVTKVAEVSEDTLADDEEDDAVDLSAKAGDFNRHPLQLETTRLRFHFEFDSFEVDQESKDYLDDLSNVLNQDPLLKVEIVGHTDYKGTIEYNQKLSERRAAMVKGFLIDRGVKSERITTSGRGELEPIDDNGSEKGRSMNRRVEFILSY